MFISCYNDPNLEFSFSLPPVFSIDSLLDTVKSLIRCVDEFPLPYLFIKESIVGDISR